MDKNALLIKLSEEGRFWSVEFDDLSPAEQVFRAIWEFEGDVNNGGFDQYYFNRSGDTAFAIANALEAVGAHQTRRIVEAANAVFPRATPPRSREARQVLLDSLDEERTDLLGRLDEEFFRYPDALTELLFDYVRRNAAEIEGAAGVGI